MKKIFAALLLILTTMTTWAYDIEVDGIYYNLISKSKAVEVTFKGTDGKIIKTYSGIVTIPEKIAYNGVTYSVKNIGDFAFFNCSGLTSVDIPNSIKNIGEAAFAYCI